MQATKKELQAFAKLITKFGKDFRGYPIFNELHYCSNNQMMMATNGRTMVLVSHADSFCFNFDNADFHGINISDLNEAICHMNGLEKVKTNVIDMDNLSKSCNLNATPLAVVKTINELIHDLGKCSTPNPINGLSFSLDSLNEVLQATMALSYNKHNYTAPIFSIFNHANPNMLSPQHVLCLQQLGVTIPGYPFRSNVVAFLACCIKSNSKHVYYDGASHDIDSLYI